MSMDSVPHIVWHKPPAANLNFDVLANPGFPANANLNFNLNNFNLNAGAPMPPENPVISALMTVGIPLVEGAKTAKEHALGLLKIASEVEQALMVQYLYAATSILNSEGEGLDNQSKLVRIAVQEMGHLATVQNLLLLVGGPSAFHVQRDEVRKTSNLNPIPFVLQPVSSISLAEYVSAEMPADVPSELKTRVEELVALAKKNATVELHRVGTIYAVLKWLFLPKAEAEAFLPSPQLIAILPDSHLADADLLPAAEIKRFEALRKEWQDDAEDIILQSCHTTKEAVHAIDLIADQGEGLDDSQQSHFRQFLDMADAFDKGLIKSVPLAISPNLGTGNGAEGGETITAPYTKLWGEVFSRQYGLLILLIHHTLHIPRQDDETTTRRTALATINITSMRTVIRRLLPLVASLPLRPGSDALAGPPFDLDPALLQPGTEAELASRHLKSLDELEGLYNGIETSPDFKNAHKPLLQNLRKFDKDKRDLLAPLVAPKIA
jgi:hypothetical protein